MYKKLFLNLGVEFGPIIIFLIASETINFITATIIFVATTILALIIGFIERRELAWFPLIVGATIVSFGTLTIIFDNPFFIIVKDTLYNGLFAIILFVGLLFNKSLLKPLFNGLFGLTEKGWRILTIRWTWMFAILAVTNEFARALLDPTAWVIFKGFATGATILFALYQFKLSKKERLPDATEWGLRQIVR